MYVHVMYQVISTAFVIMVCSLSSLQQKEVERRKKRERRCGSGGRRNPSQRESNGLHWNTRYSQRVLLCNAKEKVESTISLMHCWR